MNDFFGQPLSVGDEVAFEQPSYRNLIKGKVISFTPKFVNVEWIDPVSPVGSPYAVKKFRVSPTDVVRSPRKTLEVMNDLIALVPIEVRTDHPVLVAAEKEILNDKVWPRT